MLRQTRHFSGFLAQYARPERKNDPHLICDNYYEWYYTYGLVFRPKRILEIGVFSGHSAISLACGAPNLEEIVLIDSGTFGVPVTEGESNFKAEHPNVKTKAIEMDLRFVKDLGPEVTGKFELVHVDGEHTYEGVKRDLEMALPFVDHVIVIDDTGWEGCVGIVGDVRRGVQKFLDEHHEISLLEEIESWTGHMVLIKNKKTVE